MTLRPAPGASRLEWAEYFVRYDANRIARMVQFGNTHDLPGAVTSLKISMGILAAEARGTER